MHPGTFVREAQKIISSAASKITSLEYSAALVSPFFSLVAYVLFYKLDIAMAAGDIQSGTGNRHSVVYISIN